MLEILALMRLVRALANILEQKGRSKAWCLLAVGMWLGGEVIGCVVGLTLELDDVVIYIIGIGCALAGAVGSYVIIKSLAPAFALDDVAPVDTAVEGVTADPKNPFSPPTRR